MIMNTLQKPEFSQKKTVINTLKESSLHKILKKMYAEEFSGRMEAQTGNFIADIVCPGKKIIEIQTGNVSSLKKKALYFIKNGYSLRIVVPLPAVKTIVNIEKDGTVISRRKSPLKKNVYSVFRELTGFCELLGKPEITLEILECETEEIRTKLNAPVQSENKRRRFCKPWIKTDKKLVNITKKMRFSSKKDWLLLLPALKEPLFTVKDVFKNLKDSGTKTCENDVRLMLWVFEKAGFIEKSELKKGRAFLYGIAGR